MFQINGNLDISLQFLNIAFWAEPSHKSLKLILVPSKEKGSAEKDGVQMQIFRGPEPRVWKLHVSPAPTYLVNRFGRFHISHCWWLKVSSFDICRGDMTTKNMERETCLCSFPVFRNIFGNRGGREGEKSVNNTNHSKGERECIIGEWKMQNEKNNLPKIWAQEWNKKIHSRNSGTGREWKKLNPRIREREMETIIPGNRKGVERKFGRSKVVIKYHVDLFLMNSRRVISLGHPV